jgi:hypothetical protein
MIDGVVGSYYINLFLPWVNTLRPRFSI